MFSSLYQPWLTVCCGVLVATAIIIAHSNGGYIAFGIIVITSIVLCLILKFSRQVILLSFLFILGFVYATIRLPKPADTDISRYINHAVVIRACVLEVSGNNAVVFRGKNCLQIQVFEISFPQRKKISGRSRLALISTVGQSCQNYEPGQILQIKGQVESLDRYDQPWLSGSIGACARQNIFCQIRASVNDIVVLDRLPDTKTSTEAIVKKLDLIINEIRQRLTTIHLQYLGTKAGGLLASMVLGDQAVSIDSALIDAFKKVGLSHIVAASGFNLTVVTMITYWISRLLCPQKKWVTLIVGVNVIMYAVLAGLSASIVRAAIMCMLVLFTKYFYRRLHGPAALSLGLLINIIVDPSVLTEPGGQLSYAATAGIVCGADTLANIFSLGISNNILKILSASLSVVLMAQLAVLPVQLFHFWQTGLLFLPANLIIDPFVTPVTIAGFLASVVSLINFPGLPLGLTICRFLDWSVSVPLLIIIYVTEHLAEFNAAIVNTGKPLIISIVFYYVMLAIWLMCLKKSRYRLLVTVLFILSLLSLFYQPKLERSIVIILPQSILCINESRQALCFGNNNRLANKILAYYGSSRFNGQIMSLVKSDQKKIVAQKINECELLLAVDRQYIKPNRYRYAISLRKNSVYQSLSRRQLAGLIEPVELKICCPSKAAHFYSFGGATSFSSSEL